MVHVKYRTLKKVLIGTVSLVAVLAVIGAFKIQSIKQSMEKELYAFLKQELSSKMAMTVDVGALTIDGFDSASVRNAAVNNSFFSFASDSINVKFSLFDILKKRNGVEFVSFDGGTYGFSKDVPVVEGLRGRLSLKDDSIVVEELMGHFSEFPVSFKANGFVKRTGKDTPDVFLDAKFFQPQPGQVGSVKIAGDITHPSVDGQLNIRDGVIRLNGKGDEKDYDLKLALEHVKIHNADILTTIMFECEKAVKEDKPVITGKMYTKDSVVDFNPVKDASGIFTVSKDRVVIEQFEWANGYYVSCDVELKKKPSINAMIEVNNGEIGDLDYLILRRLSSKNYYNYGVLNGFLSCKGPVDDITTNAHFESFEGKLGRLEYQKAVFNIRGSGPLILIEDTWLYKNKKKVALSGVLDVRHMGEKNYVKQNIRIEGGKTSFAWLDWETEKDVLNDTVVLKKSLSEETSLGLKSSVKDENSLEENNTIQFEYKVSSFDKLKMELDDEDSFIGIERKYNF